MSSIINNEPNFRQDLEFVCCLANPQYLNSLATQGYFDDEAFIRYLKYLLYFKRPEYVKYILFPHCLFFLELLQNEIKRKRIGHRGRAKVKRHYLKKNTMDKYNQIYLSK